MPNMDELDEIIGEFLVESYENLDRLDQDFVDLEREPSRQILASIFRTIHTIKGTSGFLGFSKLERVAHSGENLLSKLRDGKLNVDPDITTGLLRMVDAVRSMLSSIESDGTDGAEEYAGLIDSLNRMAAGEHVGLTQPVAAAADPPAAPAAAPVAEAPAAEAAEPAAASEPAPAEPVAAPEPAPVVQVAPAPAPTAPVVEVEVDVAAAVVDEEPTAEPAPPAIEPVIPLVGELLVEKGAATPAQVVEALEAQAQGDDRSLGQIVVQEHGAAKADVLDALDALDAQRTKEKEKESSIQESSIRVDVGLLDRLMNLVGELVLTRNQVLQHTTSMNDAAFVSTTQRLNLITTELQEGVMKTRMQPIGNVWMKFPRVVRDLAVQFGKQVRIEMEGKETELDKTIIEAIKDPLTHVVRNSVDHGIESPADRVAAGKPAEGVLRLRAFHEGGQVNIEISDDGAGINVERVKAKAVERQLITAEQAARLSDNEAAALIFLPGFSTAQKVTNVSGRGVGMDVVKTNIEKIGGSVDIQNHQGEGMTLKIKIPLTLAIIPALIVSTGGDRYAIPQVSLLELVRLESSGSAGIELIGGTPVYRLRDRLLPIVYLREVLRLPPLEEAQAAVNIVVLQADARQFGLVVEGINNTEEIVVKPLGKHLQGISSFAGTTIMGDGRVALILDVLGIAQHAHVVTETREQALGEVEKDDSDRRGDLQTLLVCLVGEQRIAIPLALVARLEEFEQAQVEHGGGRELVQYREQLLPLLHLSQYLGQGGYGYSEGGEEGPLQVLVHSRNGRSVGLVVDRILDIVEDEVKVRGEVEQRTGVLYSGVIGRRVTDLLNIDELISTAMPGFGSEGHELEARL